MLTLKRSSHDTAFPPPKRPCYQISYSKNDIQFTYSKHIQNLEQNIKVLMEQNTKLQEELDFFKVQRKDIPYIS